MEKLDINKHIGKVCQEYRLKNNLTQNQVSELTGLEPRHISQIERGLSKGSIDTLIKLCNAYHITPDVILYDLLDTNIKEAISIYDEDFKKLSKRDKESILYFIKFFLSKIRQIVAHIVYELRFYFYNSFKFSPYFVPNE